MTIADPRSTLSFFVPRFVKNMSSLKMCFIRDNNLLLPTSLEQKISTQRRRTIPLRLGSIFVKPTANSAPKVCRSKYSQQFRHRKKDPTLATIVALKGWKCKVQKPTVPADLTHLSPLSSAPHPKAETAPPFELPKMTPPPRPLREPQTPPRSVTPPLYQGSDLISASDALAIEFSDDYEDSFIPFAQPALQPDTAITARKEDALSIANGDSMTLSTRRNSRGKSSAMALY